METAEVVLFWILGVVAIGSALAMVTMRNIVHGALMLVLNFLSIAALYLVLQSAFLAVIQVIVYAGAIMVVFLFVIMLLGYRLDELVISVPWWQWAAAGLVAVVLAGTVAFAFVGPFTGPGSRCGAQAGEATSETVACVGLDDALEQAPSASVGVVAERLFGRYTFPFELAALLLTVATIGAIVLGRRRDDVDKAEEIARAEPEPEPSAPAEVG